MEREVLERIRKTVIEKIRAYNLENGYINLNNFIVYSLKLNGEIKDFEKTMYDILFDYKKGENGKTLYKEFALPMDVLEKIDFSSIGFKYFKADHFDFSKLHNVQITLSSIYNLNLSYSNLDGVTLKGDLIGLNFYQAKIDNVKGLDTDTHKILLLRQKIMQELDKLEDGIRVTLDYEPRIIELILFDYIGNNKKVFALPRHILEKIDFSNVSFDCFVIHKCSYGIGRGFDFTGLYGVKINPQTIYEKDLRIGIYNGVEFTGPFDDTLMSYSNFEGSKNAFIDPNVIRHSYESMNNHEVIVILEECIFKDVTFIKPFKSSKLVTKECISYGGFGGGGSKDINVVGRKKFRFDDVDFTGSKGCVIETKAIQRLVNSVLTDTIVDSDFLREIDFIGGGINFKGVKVKSNALKNFFLDEKEQMIQIDPEIRHSLFKCTFDGCYFTSPIKNSDISYSDFTGSKNAVIDLRTLTKEQYVGTNFTDAKVIGMHGKEMFVSEDGRIGTDIYDSIDKILGIENREAVVKKEELEKARKRLIEEKRKKVEEKINELLSLIESAEKLGVNPTSLYCKIPITREELLVEIEDHFEINRKFVEYLRFLNLSQVDFSNVKCSGIDFRHSGARIYPQKVYNKDISNSIFDKENIKFFDSLDGVNYEGTDFTECDFNPNAKVI